VVKKNNKTKQEREEIRKRFNINPNIGYSIYKYIMEEYADDYPEEAANYDPENYQHEDKETILNILKNNNKGPVEMFLNLLEDHGRDSEDYNARIDYNEPKFNLIYHYNPNSNRNSKPFKYIIVSEFKREFAKWYKQEHAGRNIANISAICTEELSRPGWEESKRKINAKALNVYGAEEKNDDLNNDGDSEPEDAEAY
jgi:hypothetical protein